LIARHAELRNLLRVAVSTAEGVTGPVGSWPWMASIGKDQGGFGRSSKWQHLCGGSLVTESYVLTAGHCLKEKRQM